MTKNHPHINIPNLNQKPGVFVMADNARIVWNKQRKRWCVVVKWQGKRYYFSEYMGIKTSDNSKQPCDVVFQLKAAVHDHINRQIFNPNRYKRKKPLHLKEYAEKWLQDIHVETATLKDYKNSLTNHILPKIGHMYIGDLNFEILRELQNGIKRSNKGKKNVMGCLSSMLGDALKSGHIAQKPIFPGFSGKDAVEQKEIEWTSENNQYEILEHIFPGDQFIFRFIFMTGCRPSEARAFRWQDIKQEHIVFSVTFGPKEELKTIKNKKQRSFPMGEQLQQLLSEVPKNLTNFVFLNSKTGRPYTKNINRDHWNPACKKAGINIQLNNSGRHSFANQLLEKTDNIDLVSKFLGHSNSAVTKRYYGDHSINSMQRIIDNVMPLKKVK